MVSLSRHRKPDEADQIDTNALLSKPLWTIEDLSAFLGVPVATIYKWRSMGTAPSAYKVGKHLRWDPKDVVVAG